MIVALLSFICCWFATTAVAELVRPWPSAVTRVVQPHMLCARAPCDVHFGGHYPIRVRFFFESDCCVCCVLNSDDQQIDIDKSKPRPSDLDVSLYCHAGATQEFSGMWTNLGSIGTITRKFVDARFGDSSHTSCRRISRCRKVAALAVEQRLSPVHWPSRRGVECSSWNDGVLPCSGCAAKRRCAFM